MINEIFVIESRGGGILVLFRLSAHSCKNAQNLSVLDKRSLMVLEISMIVAIIVFLVKYLVANGNSQLLVNYFVSILTGSTIHATGQQKEGNGESGLI